MILAAVLRQLLRAYSEGSSALSSFIRLEYLCSTANTRLEEGKNMFSLQFNLKFIEFLADHRNPFLTDFFLSFTALGAFDVYILIVTLIYVAWNKQLAIRLSVLVLLTSSLNGVLKLIIKNPRPFVREGTYLKKWIVPAQDANQLAMEYSTPSGHAMSASAFYSFLYKLSGNRYFRAFAVVAILLIGLSRPYLGVHFFEDVLLGWAIGLVCALAFFRFLPRVGEMWNALSYLQQIGIALAASLALWLLSVVVNGGHTDGQPLESLTRAGFLTGIVVARPLELRAVNFDPGSSTAVDRMLRFLLTISLVTGTMLSLNLAFGGVSSPLALPAIILQYLRPAAAAFMGIFIAPWLFTKIGLAKTLPASAN